MYWDVEDVKPLSNYQLSVRIKNGRSGVFDMKPYLDKGAFQELADVNYFNQVGIFLDAVTWPHGQDIAPETLLSGMVPVESQEAHASSHYNR